MSVLCALITAFIVVLVARAVLSWFPLRPGSGMANVQRLLVDVTEWVLAPLRRLIPPIGMFDVSFLVLTFALFVVRAYVCS